MRYLPFSSEEKMKDTIKRIDEDIKKLIKMHNVRIKREKSNTYFKKLLEKAFGGGNKNV